MHGDLSPCQLFQRSATLAHARRGQGPIYDAHPILKPALDCSVFMCMKAARRETAVAACKSLLGRGASVATRQRVRRMLTGALGMSEEEVAALAGPAAVKAKGGEACAGCGARRGAPGVKLNRCTGCTHVAYCSKDWWVAACVHALMHACMHACCINLQHSGDAFNTADRLHSNPHSRPQPARRLAGPQDRLPRGQGGSSGISCSSGAARRLSWELGCNLRLGAACTQRRRSTVDQICRAQQVASRIQTRGELFACVALV